MGRSKTRSNNEISSSWSIGSWFTLPQWLSIGQAGPAPPLFGGTPQALGAQHPSVPKRNGCSRPDGGCSETGVRVTPPNAIDTADSQEPQVSTGAELHTESGDKTLPRGCYHRNRCLFNVQGHLLPVTAVPHRMIKGKEYQSRWWRLSQILY